MTAELVYTSAPAGLRPGTSGFCTVASTRGLPKRDAMLLESLSGYDFAFGLSDPQASLNPTAFAHTRVSRAGEDLHVLSRVGFAGADHTGRTNKIAHHLLLGGERPAVGPAMTLQALVRAGGLRESWQGQPLELDPGSLDARLAGASGAAPGGGWAEQTGDAGWAGALARAFRERPATPAFLVFAPGTDVLGLFAESLAVLPPEQRWQVCFSTYFTGSLPPGAECHWRGVLAGSAAAQQCARHPGALVLDLTRDLGRAANDACSDAARRGQPLPSEVALRRPTHPAGMRPKRGRRAHGEDDGIKIELLPSDLGRFRAPWRTGRGDAQLDVPAARAPNGRASWGYFAALVVLLVTVVAVLRLSEATRGPARVSSGSSGAEHGRERGPSGTEVGASDQASLPRVDTGTDAPADEQGPAELSPVEVQGELATPERREPESLPQTSPNPVGAPIDEAPSEGLPPRVAELDAPDRSATPPVLHLDRAVRRPRSAPVPWGSVLQATPGPDEGLFAWRLPKGERWKLTNTRAGPAVSIEPAGPTAVDVYAWLTKRIRIGQLTLTVEGESAVLVLRASDAPDPRADEVLEQLVFEVSALVDGAAYFCPVRTVEPERVPRPAPFGFTPAGRLHKPPTLRAPPPLQLRMGVFEPAAFPSPTVLPKEIDWKAANAPLRDTSTWDGGSGDVAAIASELLATDEELARLELRIKNLKSKLAAGNTKAEGPPHETWVEVKNKLLPNAEAERSAAEKRFPRRDVRVRALRTWLEQVARYRDRFTGRELTLIDPWGIELDAMRLAWEPGPFAHLLEPPPEDPK